MGRQLDSKSPRPSGLSHVVRRRVGRLEVARTRKAVICILLRLQDVEEGIQKPIVFLCLQARVESVWDASMGAR